MKYLHIYTQGERAFRVAIPDTGHGREPMAKASEIGREGAFQSRDDGGFTYHPPHQILRVEYVEEGE